MSWRISHLRLLHEGESAAAGPPSPPLAAAPPPNPFVQFVDELLDRMDAEDEKLTRLIEGLRG